MATVSRQSAFWAIVGLGLNTFAQDGGKVLGFPAEWSRALRLSPIVCIIDTLSVLFSIAFFSYQSRSLKDGITLAARYRCLTEDDSAEPKLERTWWFRFTLFGLGALPQAVKLLASGGTPLTKTWGMAYLVSFLVLEGLDLLQTRQRRDDHTLQTNVKAMDRYISFPSYLAVYIQGILFVPEVYLIPLAYLGYKCDMEPSSSLTRPKLGNTMNKSMSILALTPYWSLVLLSPFVIKWAINLHYERAFRSSGRDDLEVFQMFLLLPMAATGIGLGILFNGQAQICPSAVETAALAFLMTFFVWVFICADTAFKVRSFRKLFGLKHHERGEGSFPLVFTAGNIAGVICYYFYIYDPSSTYKPPWTEYLG